MSKSIIDVEGTLKNILASGFSDFDIIKEGWDNSLAKQLNTKNIKLIIKDNYVSFVDDGTGMNETQLFDANIINKNTNVCTNKQGLFGFGYKALIAGITQLKFPAVTVSQSVDGLAEVVTDYHKAIKNKDLCINPTTRMSIEGIEIWNTDSFNTENTGTIICFKGEHNLKNLDICKLKDILGYTYYHSNKDVKMSIEFYGTTHHIIPFDYIYRSQSNTRSMDLFIYKSATDFKICVKRDNGIKVLDFNNKGEKLVDKSLGNNYTEIGSFNVTSAYFKNWPDKLEHGTIYSRNGRALNFLPDTKKSTGDWYKQTIHNSTRTILEYQANNFLDELSKVNINKSNISLQNINSYLINSIKYYRNEFIKMFISDYEIVSFAPSTPRPPPTPAPRPPAPVILPAPRPPAPVINPIQPVSKNELITNLESVKNLLQDNNFGKFIELNKLLKEIIQK
jgi:hypothetical protein